MKENSLISELVWVFKLISSLGFFAAGSMIIGISYKGFQKLYGPKSEEKKWLFILYSIVVVFLLIFIYLVLFTDATLKGLLRRS